MGYLIPNVVNNGKRIRQRGEKLKNKINQTEEFKMKEIRRNNFSDSINNHQDKMRGCPRGVMVKTMDCEIVVSEFELRSNYSSYYVHFRTNTLGKSMNPPYPLSYGLNSTTTVLLGEWLWN